jgi:hypothetical protein
VTHAGAGRGAIPYFDGTLTIGGRTIGATGRAGLLPSLTLAVIALTGAGGVAGQDRNAARQDYFRAVAGYFNLPASEIAILSDWDLPADEIPVALFLARRAGVSPEALVALHESGQSWSSLAARYRVTAAAFHVPVPDGAPAGGLSGIYGTFRSTPVADWSSIRASDEDIVGLVNVRLISQTLRLPAERVLARAGSTPTYVDLYAVLKR